MGVESTFPAASRPAGSNSVDGECGQKNIIPLGQHCTHAPRPPGARPITVRLCTCIPGRRTDGGTDRLSDRSKLDTRDTALSVDRWWRLRGRRSHGNARGRLRFTRHPRQKHVGCSVSRLPSIFASHHQHHHQHRFRRFCFPETSTWLMLVGGGPVLGIC